MTTYDDLSLVEYRDEYHQKADHTLVDVRTPWEYNNGHIPGAVNIPLDELEWRHGEVPQNRPVVVVCASGNRSMDGAQILASVGHNAFNLQGGTGIWMMNGLPLDR